MVGKNNTQERFRRNATKDKRYTLKKLSVGLASVALGTVLFLNGAETVSAETEVSEPNETTDALSEVEQVTQPVQSTFQFSYVRNGGQIDGFTGDYANAHEAEKAFRHHANQHGYTLLNIRLEGNTFIADVQADNSTFQFNYLNEATGEKLDSFFGDYLNASEAEKDFRNYANEHGYTLSNVRLEGNTFTADVAVAEESQPAESTFQFIYRNKETGKKLDGFFGDYLNPGEAEKDFRNYANQHGYTLSNIRKNGQTFTADVVRQEQSGTTDSDRYVEAAKQRARQLINALDNLTAEQKADYLAQVEAAESVAQVEAVYDEAKNVVNAVEKDYSYTLNFGDRTESANLGEFDSEEQAELALRILTNEKGYKLSNLRLEGRTFIADAKVETEQDQSSEQTNRYLQEAKKRAYEIINGLENLFDTQKPSYLERIEDADSVAAVEAIVEEAQNYVNESKGGENGQAAEEPERPEYNPEQNLVTYDIQITDHNGKTQTQRVTFPSRELALNYISQLVRSYEKAGVVLKEERSDVEGRDNTFILVFEKKQAEQKPDEKPELDVPTPNENAPAPEKLDTAKAEALAAIAGLEYLSAKEKEELVELINEADNLTEVNYLVGAAYKLNINKFPGKVPAPEELDVAKAEALDAIAGLEYLSEEEKAGFVERINETVELGEVNRLVGLAFKRNIENFPEKTPEQDPAEESSRELDAAKAEALDAIAGLEYLSEEEKAGFVERINETVELGEVNRLVGLAFKRNIEKLPEKTPEFNLKAYKEAAKNALKAQGFDNELVFGLIDDATTKEGVDVLVQNIDLEALDKLNKDYGKLEQKAEELNKELEALINKVNGQEEVEQEDLDAILNKVNEIRENLEKLQKHINLLPLEERKKQQVELNEVKELLNEIEERYSYFDLDAYKEEVKQGLKARGFDNKFVLGLIDDATTKEGVDALVQSIDLEALNKLNEDYGKLEQKAEELNKELEALINKVNGQEEVEQEDLDAILNKVNEIRENLEKLQKHINLLPLEERKKQQVELNEVKELLNEIEERYSYFDLDAYKEEVKQGLKARGFDNKFVLGLIDDATTKEGVDALVQSIDLEALNKLNEDYGKLEQKAEELNKELEALINKVNGQEEVEQEDLDAILNKVNEIRENLEKLQKHINLLPLEERKKQQVELNEVKELLNEIEERYSYFDLDAYKEEVKQGLKARGFDNKFVLGLIDDATTKEGVDALVQNIDLEALDKLNEDYGKLEQKAEELNKELEALINKVNGQGEVTQESSVAILNKVSEIRKNLEKLQKHINLLPSEERGKQQAELNEVNGLLNKITDQYQYSHKNAALQRLKNQVTKDLLLLGASRNLITKIQQAPSAQAVRQLAGEFENVKVLERTKALATQIKSKVTHGGQKAKLLEELENVKSFSQLEVLKAKVGQEIAFGEKREKIKEVNDRWDKIISGLEKDSEGNTFTTEAQYSELLDLSNQYKELLSEWERLSKGNYVNESAVEVFKSITQNKFNESNISPIINIGQLAEMVETKIKSLVLDSTKKTVFEDKLTKANTVKELEELEDEVDKYLEKLDETELEREKSNVLEKINQLINDNLVGEHQVHQQKDVVNDEKSTVEDIYKADTEVQLIAFNNLKNGTAEIVEEAEELSHDLKNKYVPLIKGATTEYELEMTLKVLDVEEALEEAQRELQRANEDKEFSAHEQGLVEAANEKLEQSKKEAKLLLEEILLQHVKDLEFNKELENRLNSLNNRLENITTVTVPMISEKTLETFKKDAIVKLNGIEANVSQNQSKIPSLVPNLTDMQRKKYEDIIKKMDTRDNVGSNVDEIIQVAIAEDQLKQAEKTTQDQSAVMKYKGRAQRALDFVKGTLNDGQDYPEYKKELLKQKQHVQDLLNGQTGVSDPKVTFESKREEVTKELGSLVENFSKLKEDDSDKSAKIKEYKEQYDNFEALLNEWKGLASDDGEVASVEGLRATLRGLKVSQ